MYGKRSSERGFTLIEVLVVITIVGLLIALSTGAYSAWITRGEISKTQNSINNLALYADEYSHITGDFPPSRLQDLPDPVASTGNPANEGIEAFVLALFRKNYDGPRPSSPSELKNSDGDDADRNVTEFGNPVLLEFVDAWDNPIIYINSRDYGDTFVYLLVNSDTGEETVELRAVQDPVTGTYHNFDTYQIISAGPDGIFDTEDDVANFTRQETP